jgi:lysophospholipase L1-like esterase
MKKGASIKKNEQRVKKVSIVCIGDSLTLGYQNPFLDPMNIKETPYTDILKEKLGDSAKIYNKGLCGELSRDILHRLERDVISYQPDYVIILCGSNDLSWGFPPKEICKNLVEMYKVARAAKIEPIACTVPSILNFDDLIPARKKLNTLIKEHAKKNHILCADLFTALSHPKTGRLRDEFSSDGLHLSREGYTVMGETIYKELAPIIAKWRLRHTE